MIGQDAPVRIHHQILPIGQQLASLLMRRRTEQAAGRRIALDMWRETGPDYVFTDELGRFVEPRTCCEHWKMLYTS
ncbi:hypothetical protein CCUG63695_02772 [Mycobacteroides franklinii]|uniref:Uncharacterized protein n=1 Tax=Mycobacteroides franklinii TaxID=948102 RepID=A0A4R8R9S6_9MYCO|nr:hypothetical protein CCUG64054_02845 [Mycobacteroides franklinii]TDZ52944.1 hypothetical protein CCUG63697_01430 [Mycobacteroides franklinii]TDZ56351.1 hypothetical protein CCUG63696_02847 [Mycobacteroides franklinii]TDZ63292.1 hypothetical protein CCUG63695_02772 [Mycobacteroides franklinii]TDZ69689.1 hypothetical protein CCUG64056_02845 [Mycobacteroides franklinii]